MLPGLTATFLAEAGADLTVTDLKSSADLASSVKVLKKFKNIKFVRYIELYKLFEI
jgi:hypothetical protein